MADLSQPSEPAAISSVERVERATVLVGALSQSSGKTFGTGFIIEHDYDLYVVTCKHVVLEASSPDLFVIPRPLKTKSPPGGYKPLSLGKPTYHPNDGTTNTYDIAVLRLVGSSKKTLLALGIVPLILTMGEAAGVAEGTTLAAVGYPAEYADRELALEKLEPLRPLRIQGTVKHVPIENLSHRGFGGALREAYFAETAEPPLGKGASGGPVCVDENVVGVLVGFADLKMHSGGHTTNLRGFMFASATRIAETIGGAKPNS